MNVDFYIESSYRISELITKRYSTSFSVATSLLEKEKRRAIYAVYGFVRLADEIVDSFYGYDREFLLAKLEEDLHYALENRISTNSVLIAFADTVKRYGIRREHIDAFLESMRFDLTKVKYTNSAELERYIYGSADVVGLMCLQVFCNGDSVLYDKLKAPAQKLGSAFQKVNFLRDLQKDMEGLGRIYFPEISDSTFDSRSKQQIEATIQQEFEEAWLGIKELPGRSKLAVALAYYYYAGLLRKIRKTSPEAVISQRIRIPNAAKYLIIAKVCLMYKARLI